MHPFRLELLTTMHILQLAEWDQLPAQQINFLPFPTSNKKGIIICRHTHLYIHIHERLKHFLLRRRKISVLHPRLLLILVQFSIHKFWLICPPVCPHDLPGLLIPHFLPMNLRVLHVRQPSLTRVQLLSTWIHPPILIHPTTQVLYPPPIKLFQLLHNLHLILNRRHHHRISTLPKNHPLPPVVRLLKRPFYV